MVVPFVAAMWIVPESPRWHIMRGNEWAAEVSLHWLRGRRPALIDREIERIRKEIAAKRRERVSINLLWDRRVLRPFVISMCMMFFLQMSGFNVMVYYCVSIFQLSGSTVDPSVASIIVGVVLLLSCFLALVVVQFMGRKVILVVSIFGMSVCHSVLGACFYIVEQSSGPVPYMAGVDNSTETTTVAAMAEANPAGWLPLVAVLGFLVFGNVGYGTLIWVVTAELLPARVRSVANSVIICFAFVVGFVVAKTFVDLAQSINTSGTFWLYASFCLVGTIFTWIWVPETKGKTIEEIEEYFRGGQKRAGRPPGDESPGDVPMKTVA